MIEINNLAKIEAVRMLAYDNSINFCEIRNVNKIHDSKESKTFDSYLYRGLFQIRKQMHNREVIDYRNKYLKLLVESKNSILNLPFSKQKNILEYNIQRINEYLSYSQIYTELEELQEGVYELRITADSNSPVTLKNLGAIFDSKGALEIYKNGLWFNVPKIELNTHFSSEFFSVSVDSNLEIIKNTKSYIIKGNELVIDSINPSYQNALSGKDIASKDNNFVLVSDPKSFSFDYITMQVEDFIINYPEIDFELVSNSSLKIINGSYSVERNIVLPFGVSLEIEPGVKLTLSKGASLIIYGGLKAQGTENNSIVINNNNSPFGVVAAIGNNRSEVNINFLKLSGGSETSINGSYLSGALSLYKHNLVIMENSIISSNLGEDGLNIKDSKIHLSNNIFSSNYSDQVDLDSSIGYVGNNKFFVNNKNNSNGDGLDLSGANILVRNNSFKNFKDKGVSVGEKTNVALFKNDFNNNSNGIAVKDSSKAFLFSNNFFNNDIDVNMFIKKNTFNSPTLYILDKENFKGRIHSDIDNNIFYNDDEDLQELFIRIYSSNPEKFNFLEKELALK
jgi:parallel beta-helix repeat protein